MTSSQANADAITQELTDVKTKIDTVYADITAQIAALQAANPAVDLSGLQAAADALKSSADSEVDPGPVPPAA